MMSIGSMDIPSVSIIEELLTENVDVILFDTVDSTNNLAKELGKKGNDKSLVIAKKQTQGRGRMGRSFISNEENGIYMSLLIRPELHISKCTDMTLIASVAVCEAIESLCGINCAIKWVNDIYIGEKKVCGILTEGASRSDGIIDYAVVGIGINVTEPQGGFNDEIKDIATALYEKNTTVTVKNQLIAEIINRFFAYFHNIESRAYMGEYRRRSNLIGKSVDVYRGNDIISGVCVDIDEDGCLVVEKDGSRLVFNSGDARVRRA